MKKLFKIILTVSFFLILTACEPPYEPCDGIQDTVKSQNLIKINSLQTVYNQGDIITIIVNIPSNNTLFGYPIHILNLTQDYAGEVKFRNFETLLLNNQITAIKGSQEQNLNYFRMLYNQDSSSYELELKIKLNRVGFYSFETLNLEEILFVGNCNNFLIRTNFEGANSLGKIEFTVQ